MRGQEPIQEVEVGNEREAAAFYVHVQNEGGVGYTPWTYMISHYFKLGEMPRAGWERLGV